jgi:hypothetical protein
MVERMYKKGLVVGIIVLFVLMSFTSISGNQINNQLIKQSSRGNVLYVGGNAERNGNIDVELYVWDDKNQEWVDADTSLDPFFVRVCSELSHKGVVYNSGDRSLELLEIYLDLYNVLNFISAEPEPDRITQSKTIYSLEWEPPGTLKPGETIEFTVVVHVGILALWGRYPSDFNALAFIEGNELVQDRDLCWIRPSLFSRTHLMPFQQLLQRYSNLFPLLQKLLLFIK